MTGFDDKLNEDKIRMDVLIKQMEEMANAPKEELGKRQPGERGKYEVSRTQDACRDVLRTMA